jgi:hypothetical protein
MISSSSHLLHTTPSFCNLPAVMEIRFSGSVPVWHTECALLLQCQCTQWLAATARWCLGRVQDTAEAYAGVRRGSKRKPPTPPAGGDRDRRHDSGVPRAAASIACSCLRRPRRRRRARRPVRELRKRQRSVAKKERERDRGGRCGQRNTTTTSSGSLS